MAQDQAQRARHELLKAQAVAASDSRLREAAKAAAAAEATAANETVAAAEAYNKTVCYLEITSLQTKSLTN